MSISKVEETVMNSSTKPVGTFGQPNAASAKKLGRLKMLGILLVCALPVFISYFMYYVVRPDGRTNYGSLLTPPLDAAKLNVADKGKPSTLADLKGKWLMVSIGPSSCDQSCVERLYLVRQVRATTGKLMDRIDRVWLVTDDGKPDPKILEAYDGQKILQVNSAQLPNLLPAESGQDSAQHIFIVDPLGNIIMRFPAKPDPNKMKKDVGKLLRASRIG
jgi:hypothetical protein